MEKLIATPGRIFADYLLHPRRVFKYDGQPDGIGIHADGRAANSFLAESGAQ